MAAARRLRLWDKSIRFDRSFELGVSTMIAARFLTAATLLFAGFTATAAHAEHRAVQRDAAQLASQADQLFHEIRTQFAQAPNYRDLISTASRLRADAIHFERSLENIGRVRDLERQLDSLDHLAQDLSDEIFDASRGPRYSRFVAHCDPRVAQKLTRSVENTIHCLDERLADLPARGVIGVGGPVPYGLPQYNDNVQPAPPVQWSGSGFSIRFGR
jgi:hypothetical protein